MCGIAGLYNYRDNSPPVDPEELVRIRDHMIRRGPDGAGLWLDGERRVGLAHRRLAIIDLSESGAQPMQTADGRFTITFNGEIYNYRELRSDLEKDGVVFRSQSDTEVLLHLYRKHGPAMLPKLRGMYAFGLWDAVERELFLARDPFGIKPLYYADDGKTLRFASQVKALVAGGHVSAAIEPAAEIGYYIWGAVPEPLTIYREASALPAGTWLRVRAGGVGVPVRHFSIAETFAAAEAAPRTGRRRSEHLDAVVDALRESVAAHMIADVPVGLFLSAGIDSNLIGRFARDSTPQKIRAVTLAFYEYANTPSDESPIASLAAHAFGLDHSLRYVDRAEFTAEQEAILAAMDQPTTDGVNSYFVGKVAAEAGLKVALSGLGGDELLAGYPSFGQVPRLVRRVAGLPRPLRALGPLFRRLLSPLLPERYVSPKYAGVLEFGGEWFGAYMLRRSLHMPWELPGDFSAAEVESALHRIAAARTHEHDVMRRLENSQLKVSCLELGEYLRNQLVRDTDWASMAHSLEVRVPFLDVPLLEVVATAIAEVPDISKPPIARHANVRLPRAVWDRPKSGFSIPVMNWLGDCEYRHRGLRGWSREVAVRFGFPSLRVLALVTDAYGGIGGIAKFNRDLLNSVGADPRCRSIDAFPRVITRELEKMPAALRFHDEAAHGKAAYLKAILGYLLTGRRVDWIICGHVNYVFLAWLIGAVKGCRVTLVVHGVEVWAPHRNRIIRALLPRIDQIVAVSNFTVDKLLAWSSVFPARLVVLPNCVELDRYSPRPPAAYLLDRYGLRNKTIIMTVGRLVAKERFKGFDEVIEAMPALRQRIAELHYLIVGDGDDVGRLKDKVATLGLTDWVTLAGYVPEDEKADHYSLARAYVMPSRGEGFGIVYLEALASGIPVLGSKVDGSRDALMGGLLGVLVDPDYPDEIVNGIVKVLQKQVGCVPEELSEYSYTAFRERVQRHLVTA